MDDKLLRINQFEKFYYFLMKNAPEDYKPWFFPCEKNGKNPCPSAVLKIDGSSKGSWHHPAARLNKEQVIEHIKQGYNIGLSAREGDPLIIIDIDEKEYLNQTIKETLTATSRKRDGTHSFCWDKDGTAKINLPTDYGEIRSNNQYVLSCGSYVPFDLKDKKDKKAFDGLSQEAREDELLGYYTIRECISPKKISFDEVPKIFKDKATENLESETKVLQGEERKEFKGEGKYTDLFNLKVSNIVGLISPSKRQGHPLHESDTDANFSLSKDGSIAHCWRHLVSLNAFQYLCVKAGYKSCVDCGTPHKGRGISKIRGDKKALEIAYEEAIKLKLITKKEKILKKDDTPIRYMNRYVDEEKEIIIEQIYNKEGKSLFCIYNFKKDKFTFVEEWNNKGIKFLPQEGEEIEKKAVLLPTHPEEYTEDELDKEIKTFIKKWLDVPEKVIKFGIWNTKRSWVYDKFHSLNYLRALGDTGVGKSRYLNTFGFIHYTPIFTTGTTTPAPLFRILDKWGGTLVMDEADLKRSDESEDIIKIINQGFERGNFIMRCDQNDASKISFFDPYSPKILATRKTFQDKATESRCITHVMTVTENENIPVNLDKTFYSEALSIRNKLLMWRFKNYFKINLDKKYDLGNIEPRVKQIVSSYIALFGENEQQMEEFKEYILNYQEELIEERQQSFEGSIIGAIHSLLENGDDNITATKIIEKGEFTNQKTGKSLHPRALNSYLKTLGFKKSEVAKIDGKTQRIIPIEQIHIFKLFERYGYGVTKVTVLKGISQIVTNEQKPQKSLDSPQKPLEGVPLRNDRNLRNLVTQKTRKNDEISGKKPPKNKDFGQVDFQDYEIENMTEQYEKETEEIEKI